MSLVADNDGRESLMKMLLSSPLIPIHTTTTPSLSLGEEFTTSLSGFPSPMSESASDELIPSITNYVHSLGSLAFEEPEAINKIVMEHSYSKAWNWRHESSSVKPARSLLVHKPPACPGCHDESEESYVDVDGPTSPPPPLPYDVDKGRTSMNEIETHLIDHYTKCDDTDWESNIDRTHWSLNENSYYCRIKDILHEDLVARLTVEHHRNEPVLRRAIIDRSVSKFRQAFNTIGWDIKTLQWMHNLLLDNLNKRLLSVYLDILQGLKDKLPILIDKIMFSGVLRHGATSYESLFDLFKRPWDPLGDNVVNSKIKKIPNNPIIFVCPSCPQSTALPSRHQQLMTFLNAMATVENVTMNLGFSSSRLTLTQIVEHMLASSRSRLQEVKIENPDRPIILLGFHAGASLAFQIAQTETVTCIVCIGFDIHTMEGKRGSPDDIILDIPYPVLFVMGENSARSHPEEMENLREKMSAETSLIIIGSADDSLRLSCNKKILEGVTQSMVDRCIMDEIADYVTTVILNPFPSLKQQGPSYITVGKKQKQVRIRKMSKRRASSESLEADKKSLISPKRPRPGRPKGSVKNKITPHIRNMSLLQTINNPPPEGITVTMGSLCSSPSKKQGHDDSSSTSISNLKSLNSAAGVTTINLTPQNNHLKIMNKCSVGSVDNNFEDEDDILNRAVMSIMPESLDEMPAPRKVLTPNARKKMVNDIKQINADINALHNSKSLSNLLQGPMRISKGSVLSRVNNTSLKHEVPIIMSDRMLNKSGQFDLNKYKLASYVGNPSSSKLLMTSNINSIPLRTHQNSKFVKVCMPSNSSEEASVNRPVLLTPQSRIQRQPSVTSTKSFNDQLAGTNILDIPIIFADNDGNINDSMKVEDNQVQPTNLGSSHAGNSPIKMVVVNQPTANIEMTQMNLKNVQRPITSTAQKIVSNNSNSRYPKILLRRSSIQNSPKFKNKPQPCPSPTIDFKNIDLESELVANKVLKTIPPIVQQTKGSVGITVSSNSSDKNNHILLTVDSKNALLKSTLNRDIRKSIVRSPIILKPGAQMKTIPTIKAQNILSKSFMLKKNSAGNFVTGQKLTIQNLNSKDHSDA